MERAVGVVAMGGYNTFCEILSFDKRALIVPRTKPRMEQYIRAARGQELGLCRVLVEDERQGPQVDGDGAAPSAAAAAALPGGRARAAGRPAQCRASREQMARPRPPAAADRGPPPRPPLISRRLPSASFPRKRDQASRDPRPGSLSRHDATGLTP